MKRIRSLGTLLVTALLLTLGSSGTAFARWHTANDTAINGLRVCKNGARIKVADYIYEDGQLDTVPRDADFHYDLVVTNPPFHPDPLADPVPQAPPEQVVLRRTIRLVFDPIDIRFGANQPVTHYAYSKTFKLTWTRRLAPGTKVGFDLFPDTSDDVINDSKVHDCRI